MLKQKVDIYLWSLVTSHLGKLHDFLSLVSSLFIARPKKAINKATTKIIMMEIVRASIFFMLLIYFS